MPVGARYRYHLALGAAACILIIGAVIGHRHMEQKEAAGIAFFEKTLRDAHIAEYVTIRGITYSVIDGTVTSGSRTIETRDRFDALRIAYALTLAERSPLVAAPLTDPDELDRAANQLGDLALGLASVQTSRSESSAVRSSLYPVAFLHALAGVERARQAFIGSGTDNDEQAYAAAQRAALYAYDADLNRFRRAFVKMVPDRTAAYAVFEGVVTRQGSLDALNRLAQGARRVGDDLAARSACIAGSIAQCDTALLSVPHAPSDRLNGKVTAAPTALQPRLQEIRSAYAAASGGIAFTKNPVIELTSSTCVRGTAFPPLFLLGERERTIDHSLSPEFVGNVAFVPVDSFPDVSYYQYFKENGVRYVFFPIFETYKCPSLLSDMSRIFEVTAAQKAAASERYSAYAQGKNADTLRTFESRLNVSNSSLYEADALRYAGLATTTLTNTALPRQSALSLYDLILASEDGTAGLVPFVRRTIQDESVDITLKKGGTPTELSASYLFYVRSGFFSFFQGTNPSVTGDQAPPVSSQAASSSPFALFSDLRRSESVAALANDMKFFYAIHKKASDSMPIR